MNETGLAVYLDFKTAIERLGKDIIKQRYGNLFDMYEEITDVSPYEQPMQIFPAVHYTMGGIWVDYNLMTTIPGLYAIGEANFSDHGANRLGASALMQGLADGYFVLPYTIGDYLSHKIQAPKVKTDTKAFDEAEKGVKEKIAKLLAINGKQSVDDIHKKLGHIMWENVGMARTKESLEKAITEIQALRKEFWKDVKVVGKENDFNVELEKALRLADFLELGELMARGVVRRPLPHGTPNRGGRSQARRRELRIRRRMGVQGHGPGSGTHQGAAELRVRAPRTAQLQRLRPFDVEL